MNNPFTPRQQDRLRPRAKLDDIAPFGAIALAGTETEPLIILHDQIHGHTHDIEEVIPLQAIVEQAETPDCGETGFLGTARQAVFRGAVAFQQSWANFDPCLDQGRSTGVTVPQHSTCGTRACR